jgi:hypothetical protein
MDCMTFIDRLEALLAGRLSGAARRAVEAHAKRCADCGGLLEALTAVEAGTVHPPAGLAEKVLERTSGSPCAGVRRVLCDRRDDPPGETDAALLRGHLAHCPACAALGRVLAGLAEDLPRLAEVAPPPSLLEGVLARTTGRRAPGPAWPLRWAGFWRRLLQRPRFALEGAYVGALLVALLFGFPSSPLAGLPRRAVDLATGLQAPAERLERRVSRGVQRAWERTGARVAAGARDTATEASLRSSRALAATRHWLGTLWDDAASEQEKQETAPPGNHPEGARGDRR